MAENTIKCPSCGHLIPLTETLSNEVKEGLRKEFEAKAREKEIEFKKREDDLERKNRELEASKKAVAELVEKRLAAEKARILEDAEKKARQGVDVELKDLKEANEQKEKLLDDARRAELEMRKKARELEERQRSLELENARRLDAERDKIRQTALDMFSEEHRLKDFEKDKKISDMLKTIEELKRKGEQGSMQTQGEVLELDLEAMLRGRFLSDVVEPVQKGIRGADLLQKVYTRTGQHCGSIAWESKRTKGWSDEWIAKLKDDQREIKADIAVLVSETLPKGITAFALVDGVWVSSIALAGSLAEALRVGLMQLSNARLSAVGKNEKMEALYAYLTGSEFRQKIEGIVEAFRGMKEDLEQEKRAMLKIWAKREKQIERVVANTLKMYGDMQGIATLPDIKSLELPAGAGAEEAE